MRGSVVKKGKRWYICYSIGKDADGKRIQKWESGWTSKQDAERALRQRVTEIENTYERKGCRSTVAEFLDYWLRTSCQPRLAENTLRGYRVNVEKHIVPFIGKIQLTKLLPTDIQSLYTRLADCGLSGTSIRYVHNNLHRALDYAVKQQLIFRNPAECTEPPRVNRYEAAALTPGQVRQLLKAAEGKETYLPVLLAVSLGLRRGETLGLCWRDVDFENGTATITRSAIFSKEGFHLAATKTRNSRRTLKLPDTLAAVLQAVRRAQEEQALIFPGFNPYGLVCCRADGSPFSPNALQHQFRELVDACDLPRIRFHDLRHTNATLMLRCGVSSKIVSAMLGHSSVGITLDTYSHVMTDMQDGAVDAMERLLTERC